MAGSINKVILVGNLGKDPEIKHFENGGSIAKFPLATKESYKDRESGQRVDLPTDWHNVVIKRAGLAKVAETYLKKGNMVYIEGKVKYRSYEKDGETRYVTEIHAEELTMLGRNENSPSQGQASSAPIPEPDNDDLPF